MCKLHSLQRLMPEVEQRAQGLVAKAILRSREDFEPSWSPVHDPAAYVFVRPRSMIPENLSGRVAVILDDDPERDWEFCSRHVAARDNGAEKVFSYVRQLSEHSCSIALFTSGIYFRCTDKEPNLAGLPANVYPIFT